MTAPLTWSGVDARWPGASAMWDLEVASEDWEPRLHAIAGVLVAEDASGERRRAWVGEHWADAGILAEPIVEAFRICLGLLPWREHEANARRVTGTPDRRSGRTTRRMLYALAQCEITRAHTLSVDAESDGMRRHCADMALGFIARLGLHIRVSEARESDRRRPPMRGVVEFRDHYMPRQGMAIRGHRASEIVYDEFDLQASLDEYARR